MQLWYAPTSPFARKVRIAAHELGLAGAIDLVEVDPWSDGRLRALNPLAKVPTMVLDGGEALFESAVICEYLDALAGPRLFPPPPGRWPVLRMQGVADGAAAAAGRLFAEQRRPPAERSAVMAARFEQAIEAALDHLEARGLDASLATIGDIAAAAFVGYLDFRWPERDWRAGRDRLAAAYAAAKARPSMSETEYRLATERP